LRSVLAFSLILFSRAAVGSAKESIGSVLGNERMQAEGALQKKEGQVRKVALLQFVV
jgi:hypothetical protein